MKEEKSPTWDHSVRMRSKSIKTFDEIEVVRGAEAIASHPNVVNDVQYTSIGAETLKEHKRATRSGSRRRSKCFNVINKVDVVRQGPLNKITVANPNTVKNV